MCSCMVAQIKKNTDADVFRLITLPAEGKGNHTRKLADRISVNKQMQLATAGLAATQACMGKSEPCPFVKS